MRSNSALPLAMFAATGLLFGASAVSGQDSAAEGVVRVTDTPAPQSDSTVEGDVSYDQYSGDCNGDCNGDCKRHHWCCLYQDGECVTPDHGFCRPIKYPIRRMPVQYYSYWPARWYGEPGSGIAPNAPRFPVIYTPTDTTQLGMYYQRVPQWLPNPAMIPPAPWPTDWHNRQCANGYGYGCGAAWVRRYRRCRPITRRNRNKSSRNRSRAPSRRRFRPSPSKRIPPPARPNGAVAPGKVRF